MDFTDYYSELGVQRSASDAEIKSAFRKLAREFHPDANPNNASAEERFKRISEAYEALGDPEKRAKYDAIYDQYQAFRSRGGRGGNTSWEAFRGGSQQPFGQQSPFGDMFGGSSIDDFFEQLFGQRSSRQQQTRRQAKPTRTVFTVTLSLDEAYHGVTKRLSLRGEKLDVTFKPGIASGQRLSIPQGELEVTVSPHPRFTRDGNDLRCSQPVPLSTLLLGGEITVSTLGKPLTVKVQPGTPIGKTLRVKGQGMPNYGSQGAGDMYVTLTASIPSVLTSEQRKAAEALRESGL
jgi:curved DNA-binding protein